MWEKQEARCKKIIYLVLSLFLIAFPTNFGGQILVATPSKPRPSHSVMAIPSPRSLACTTDSALGGSFRVFGSTSTGTHPRPLAALHFNSKKRWEHISGEETCEAYEFAVNPSHLISWHDDKPSRGEGRLGYVEFCWGNACADGTAHRGYTWEMGVRECCTADVTTRKIVVGFSSTDNLQLSLHHTYARAKFPLV